MTGVAAMSAIVVSSHGKFSSPGDTRLRGPLPGAGLVSALGATDAYGVFYHQSLRDRNMTVIEFRGRRRLVGGRCLSIRS